MCTFSSRTKKRITGDKILFQQKKGRKQNFPSFWAILNRPFFLFFCHRGVLYQEEAFVLRGKRRVSFFPNQYRLAYRHFSHRDTLLLQRYAHKYTHYVLTQCFLLLNPRPFAPRKLLPRKSNNPKSRDPAPSKRKRSARNLYPRETSSPPRCCPSGSSPSATPTRRRRE